MASNDITQTLSTPKSDDKRLIEIQLSVLDEILSRHLTTCGEVVRKYLITLFFEIRYQHRIHRLVETETVKELWDGIRKKEELTDAVLEIATDWRFLAFQNDDHYERTIKQLATAISCVGVKESLVDDTIKERMKDLDAIPGILKHNPWLAMLIMSRYSKHLTNLIKQNHE